MIREREEELKRKIQVMVKTEECLIEQIEKLSKPQFQEESESIAPEINH